MDNPERSDPHPRERAERHTLETLVEGYLRSKSRGGGGSYKTTAESVLRRWIDWMDRHGWKLEDLEDRERGVTIMREYAQYLTGRVLDDDLAASTAQQYYAYVRACLSWGVADRQLDSNPATAERATEELPTSTSSRSEQQHWSQEQAQELLRCLSERVEEEYDDDPTTEAARQAVRDRAMVSILWYPAVRSAEVFRRSDDDRPGRQGLRWKNVDLDNKKIRIFGKGEQAWIWHPLTGPSADHLRLLKRRQKPASDEWPVFASSDARSLWATARKELDNVDVEGAVDELGGIFEVLREHEIVPPAITTHGVRSRLETLTEQADVDVDGDYLKPHGARRGMIGEVFRRDRGEAQDLGRHQDMATTNEAYRHLDVDEQRERVNDIIDEIETGTQTEGDR